MQIDLFDQIVKSILLYGCEIWVTGNLEIIKRPQLKFLKLILNLQKIHIFLYDLWWTWCLSIRNWNKKTRLNSFWKKSLESKSNKLSKMISQIVNTLYKQSKCRSVWIINIKNLITKNGFGKIWEIKHNKQWFCIAFKQILKHSFFFSIVELAI